MDEIDGLIAFLRFALKAALVLALPIAAMEIGTLALRRIAPPDFFKIPLVAVLPKFLGITLGVLLIYVRYDRRTFDLHEMFVPESVWHLSLWQFLGERANPLDYGIGTIFDYLAGTKASETFVLLMAATVILLAGSVAAPFFFWPAPVARRAALSGLALAAVVTYLTIYLICLLFWSLFLLNFWTFALIGVMFQYYRTRASD